MIAKSTIVEITNISQPRPELIGHSNLQQQKLQTFLSRTCGIVWGDCIYNSRNYKHFLAIKLYLQNYLHLQQQKLQTFLSPHIHPGTTPKSTIVEITNISQPETPSGVDDSIYNSRNYKHFLARLVTYARQQIDYLQQQKLQTFLSPVEKWVARSRSTIVEITNISQPCSVSTYRCRSTIVEITNISQPNDKEFLRINLQQQKLQTFLSPSDASSSPGIYNSRNYKHFLALFQFVSRPHIYNSRNYKHFLAL